MTRRCTDVVELEGTPEGFRFAIRDRPYRIRHDAGLWLVDRLGSGTPPPILGHATCLSFDEAIGLAIDGLVPPLPPASS